MKSKVDSWKKQTNKQAKNPGKIDQEKRTQKQTVMNKNRIE